MNDNDIDLRKARSALSRLDASPLFALFRGSRELFHSNSQRWLVETCPEAVRLFVPDIALSGAKPRARQEVKNLDLVIDLDRDLIVVENKVKDTPRSDQLAKYDERINKIGTGKTVHKILLTLMPAGFVPENGWQELSYAELARRIDLLPDLSGEAEVFWECYGRMAADLSVAPDADLLVSNPEQNGVPA